MDPDKWEFANEGFLRGKRHLLKNIRRRKAPPPPPPPPPSNLAYSCSQSAIESSCVEVGSFGLDMEIDRLRRDKQVLMAELVKLRQQQQNTKAYIQEMEQRLEVAEKKQQKALSFLARAIRSPEFLQEMMREKRRERIGSDERESGGGGDHGFIGGGFDDGVKVEDQEFGEVGYDQDLEVGKVCEDSLVDQEWNISVHGGEEEKNFDQGFWEGLISDGLIGVDDVLGEELGFLDSNPTYY